MAIELRTGAYASKPLFGSSIFITAAPWNPDYDICSAPLFVIDGFDRSPC
jgi:hypothetical protein